MTVGRFIFETESVFVRVLCLCVRQKIESFEDLFDIELFVFFVKIFRVEISQKKEEEEKKREKKICISIRLPSPCSIHLFLFLLNFNNLERK